MKKLPCVKSKFRIAEEEKTSKFKDLENKYALGKPFFEKFPFADVNIIEKHLTLFKSKLGALEI